MRGSSILNNTPTKYCPVDPIPPDTHQLAGVPPSSSVINQPFNDPHQPTGVGQNNRPTGVPEPESDKSESDLSITDENNSTPDDDE